MPLYNQATSLNTGRGNFAPSVTYYAGIKAPDQPAIHLPKANASFNIDLSSIGHAVAQMSRDQASIEETKFKLEYAQKEKAEAAAKKQLEIDTSNALAQEISNVTAQLDQGIINPLTASRMQREIKDRYRAMGILSASTIASTANAEDGGAGTFLQSRREQYGKFEMDQNNKELEQIWKDVPSSRNMSNAEALNLNYNIKQAGIRAAAAIANNNNNSGTQELSTLSNMTLARDGFDAAIYQAATTMSNAVVTSPSMSPSQILQNAYENTFQFFKGNGASDEVALAAANRAMTYSKPYTDLIQNGTKEEKEFWQNKAETGKYLRQVMFHRQFPLEAFAAENTNIDFSAYGIEYNPGIDGRQGTVVLPSASFATSAMYQQTGNTFRSVETPYAVTLPNGDILPITPETSYVVANPKAYLTSLVSGKMPVGDYIGRPVATGLTQTAAYNPNMNLSGEELRGRSRSEVNTAINNTKAFYNSINSSTGSNNLKRQGDYDGINYQRVMNSFNTKKGMEIWNNNPETWNQVYEDYGRFIQDSKYLYNFLRIAPDGSLTMLPIKGLLNTVASITEGEDFKERVRAINASTQGFDPETRASLSRVLVNKRGQGVLDADPKTEPFTSTDSTMKEVVGDKAIEGLKLISNKVVNEQIVPLEKKVVKQLEKNIATPVLKWAEDKGVSIANTYSNWLNENNAVDTLTNRVEFSKVILANYIRDLRNEFENKIAKRNVDNLINRVEDIVSSVEPVETELTLPEPNVGGLQDIIQSLRRSDIDFQLGSIDFRDPNALPIVIEDDGKSWASIKFGTISANGRTYIVPSLTEDGKPSTVKKEFDKGRTLGSIAGEDERAINNAEYMGQKIRQYLIDRDEEKAKAKMAAAQADIRNITPEQKTTNNSSNIVKDILEINEALNEIPEGFVEGVSNTAEFTGRIAENILSIGKLLAYNKIAHDYGFADAQQMLEQTETPLLKDVSIPLVVGAGMTLEKITDALEYLMFTPSDLKPVTYFRNLFKNDKAGLFEALDDLISLTTKGNVSNKTKAKMKKDLRAFLEKHEDADVAYYQNYQGIL